MARKLILSLAAIGTLASTALISGSADAMVAHRGNGNRPPIYRPNHPHFHGHTHVWRIHERGYVRPVGYVERVAVPGPCTCLTKDLSLIHISEPTRQAEISYAVFCLK